ncbi:MAG: hypothetical protein M3320_01140 [Actinomycetota bacterium]|nr:hypothetical protein [Actinomycetota bacterium]MDQ5807260.1 hypothetical protein [Actinomycetota bacterium]
MTKSRIALAALVIAVLSALAVPSAAPARLIEIGALTTETELPAPSCPTRPCFAVSRTTGYQAKVGTNRGLMKVPANGRIVAWTIRLSRPGRSQITFFNRRLGGEASAGLSVLKPGRRLFGRVMAQSPIVQLQPFFGQTVQFPLEQSLPARKGQLIALTVPTWAPALATNLGPDTSWRASRPAGECDDTETQTAQAELRDLAQYRCLYQRVRLTYTATLITEPRPNRERDRNRDRDRDD